MGGGNIHHSCVVGKTFIVLILQQKRSLLFSFPDRQTNKDVTFFPGVTAHKRGALSFSCWKKKTPEQYFSQRWCISNAGQGNPDLSDQFPDLIPKTGTYTLFPILLYVLFPVRELSDTQLWCS